MSTDRRIAALIARRATANFRVKQAVRACAAAEQAWRDAVLAETDAVCALDRFYHEQAAIEHAQEAE